MRNIYRSLLLILTAATQKELARYVAYLKAENKILRSRLPERVMVEPVERNRLVRLGAKLSKTLDELVTIGRRASARADHHHLPHVVCALRSIFSEP